MKPSIRKKQNTKEKGESSKTKELVPMLKNLNLGYPTWLSFSS